MGLKEKQTLLGRHIILVADTGIISHSSLLHEEEIGYELILVHNGRDVLSFLDVRFKEVAMLLSEDQLPDMSGLDLVSTVRSKENQISRIPVILFSEHVDGTLLNDSLAAGCTHVVSLPIEQSQLAAILQRVLEDAEYKTAVTERISKEIYQNENRSRLFAMVLSEAVEFKGWQGDDLYPLNSGVCIKILLEHLRKRSSVYSYLDDNTIEHISLSAILQNIGYVTIPEEILSEPGKLTPEEYEIIKTHPEAGARILEEARNSFNDKIMDTAIEIARYHHERWDGSGYPAGLKGYDIPISAQAASIAGVYATLTETRPYRKAYNHDEAIQMILRGDCGAFNPELLECLKECSEELRSTPKINEYEKTLHSAVDRNVKARVRSEGHHPAHNELIEKRQNFYASLSHDCVFEYQADPEEINFSEHTINKFGLPALVKDVLDNEILLDIIPAKDLKSILQRVKALRGENERIRYDVKLHFKGIDEWNRIIAGPIYSEDGRHEFLGMVGVIMNVQNEYQRISQLEQEATYDPLTKLRNRHNTQTIIEQHLNVYTEDNYCFCIMDFDDFKSINDQMGHAIGDVYLMELAMLLRHYIRKDDIVGRLGGDEFVWFFRYDKNPEEIIRRVFEKLNGSVVVDEGPLLSLSLGAVTTKQAGRDVNVLYQCADAALYEAKRTGKGIYKFFQAQISLFK